MKHGGLPNILNYCRSGTTKECMAKIITKWDTKSLSLPTRHIQDALLPEGMGG